MSQVPTNEVLDFIPTLVKPHKAIHKLANGKALGFDEITAEVFKNGCLILARYNGDFQNISPGSLAPALVIFQAYVEGIVLFLWSFTFSVVFSVSGVMNVWVVFFSFTSAS